MLGHETCQSPSSPTVNTRTGPEAPPLLPPLPPFPRPVQTTRRRPEAIVISRGLHPTSTRQRLSGQRHLLVIRSGRRASVPPGCRERVERRGLLATVRRPTKAGPISGQAQAKFFARQRKAPADRQESGRTLLLGRTAGRQPPPLPPLCPFARWPPGIERGIEACARVRREKERGGAILLLLAAFACLAFKYPAQGRGRKGPTEEKAPFTTVESAKEGLPSNKLPALPTPVAIAHHHLGARTKDLRTSGAGLRWTVSPHHVDAVFP